MTGYEGRKILLVEDEAIIALGEKRSLEQYGYRVSVAHSGAKAIAAVEAALRESEQKYREMVDKSSSIVLEWDTRGTVLFMNKYGLELFGYTESELIGRNVVGSILPAVDSSGFDLAGKMSRVELAPDDYYSGENENTRKDGRRLWIAWTNRGIHDGSGALVKTLSIGIDRTPFHNPAPRAISAPASN